MAGVSATGVAGTGVGVVGTDAGAGALLGLVSEKERGLREKRVGGVFSTAAFSLIGRAGGLLSRGASVSICSNSERENIEGKGRRTHRGNKRRELDKLLEIDAVFAGFRVVQRVDVG